VHGPDETARAEQAGRALFGEEVAGLDERSLLEVFAEAPSTTLVRTRLDGPGLSLVDLLVETGLAPSRGRARTIIEQGGAYVNNRRQDDAGYTVGPDDLIAGRYLVLRRGKKDYHLVKVD
jgi:tyrosyl-tRNA synthetase